jgi:hypothetical protein
MLFGFDDSKVPALKATNSGAISVKKVVFPVLEIN